MTLIPGSEKDIDVIKNMRNKIEYLINIKGNDSYDRSDDYLETIINFMLTLHLEKTFVR